MQSLLSRRFVEYGLVGLTGVFVNLGAFYLLAHVGGVQRNLASAAAIEVSILTNFALHDAWTFRDRKGRTGTAGARFLRFQSVSLVGLAVQLSTFIASNAALFWWLWPAAEIEAYARAAGGGGASVLIRVLVDPPPVGRLDLVSQLAGIVLGTLWNFLVNNFWTWRDRHEPHDAEDEHQGRDAADAGPAARPG